MLCYTAGDNIAANRHIEHLSPSCRLCESVSTIGVQNLLVVEDTTWTSQEEDCRSHVGVLTRTTSRVRHLRLDDGLVVLVGLASCHLQYISIQASVGWKLRNVPR